MLEILDFLNPYSNLIVAISTVVLTVITALILIQNSKFIKSQYKPNIIVGLRQDEHSPNLIDIYVENVGTSPAHSVLFNTDWSTVIEKQKGNVKTTLGDISFLKNGIPMLAPGQKHTHLLLSTYDDFTPDPFEIEVTYYDSSGKKHTYPRPFVLDIKQYDKAFVDNDPLRRIAKAVETIQQHSFFGSGNRSIVAKLESLCKGIDRYFFKHLPEGEYFTLIRERRKNKDLHWVVRRFTIDEHHCVDIEKDEPEKLENCPSQKIGYEDFLTSLLNKPDYKGVKYIPREQIPWHVIKDVY